MGLLDLLGSLAPSQMPSGIFADGRDTPNLAGTLSLLGGGPGPMISRAQGPTLPNVSLTPSGPSMPTPPQATAAAAPDMMAGLSGWNKFRYGTLPAIGSTLGDALAPTPPGMEGLLSPDEIQQARHRSILDMGLSLLANAHGVGAGNAPSFGQALQQGVQAAHQGMQENTVGRLQNQAAAMQLAQQLRVMKFRQALQQSYAPGANETRQQQIDRTYKMWLLANEYGDDQMAGHLGDVLSKLGEDPDLMRMRYAKPPRFQDLGDRTVEFDPISGQPIAEYRKTLSPEGQVTLQRLGVEQAELGERMTQDRAERMSPIASSYLDATKDDKTVGENMMNLMNGTVQRAAQGDPGATMTLLDSFLRTNNPGATVRNGVLQNMEEMRSLPGDFQAAYNRWLHGGKLSPAQVYSMAREAVAIGKQRQAKYQQTEQTYRKRASLAAVDPASFIDDPYAKVDWNNILPQAQPGAKRGTPDEVNRYLPTPR